MRYWRFPKSGPVNSVQSCSNDEHVPPGAKEITEDYFNNYLSGLPVEPVVPRRDIWKEIDDINLRLDAL